VGKLLNLQRLAVSTVGAVAALTLIASSIRGQPQNSAQQGASSEKASNIIDLHPPPKKYTCRGIGCMPVTLIQIDAVVTDKDGRFVAGLGPKSFALKEEGQLQVLTSVDHFVAGGTGDGREFADVPIVIDLGPSGGVWPQLDSEKIRPIVINRRMIVFFFDLTTMAEEDLSRSVDAAKKFINNQMSPADLVAVVSFGRQFKINSDFTNSHADLECELTSLMPGKDGMSQSLPGLSTDIVPEVDDGVETEDQTEFNIFNVDNRLYAVDALAGLLGAIPGRKSVIEFSGGIKQTVEGNTSAVKAATDAANMNVVSLYEVDMSNSTVPGWRNILASVARDSGGKLFTGVKDFAPIFKQVQDDSQDYYLLSYYSTNTKRDGLYRNVSVKVEKVRGAQVKFRQGYFGPKDVPNTAPQHR
jgi:VWFA-related protein